MPQMDSFQILVIHVVTVPLTAAFGFFLGWVFRAAAEKRGRKGPGRADPVA
jgi:hypothetical protein